MLSKEADVGLWVFGYGSIIWRPDFPHTIALWATAVGWSRRFWQGSHDHRGTPELPGRVLTLVPFPGESCKGRVFGIAPNNVDRVLGELDYREKNGYQRHTIPVQTAELGSVDALSYMALPDNAAWLGDAADDVIANQIRDSHGPSGSNKDYAISLYRALQREGIHDEHIQTIAELVV